MNKENVDELYLKLGKNVPKEKREKLKNSLQKAENSKFQALKNMKLASKSPIKGLNGLVCFFATLLGAVFLACNLFAFLYINPTYTAYSQYSAKLSDDLSAYYAQLTDFGKAGNSVDGSLLLPLENEMTMRYDALQKELNEKQISFNGKLAAFNQEATFVGNKTANYLNVKVQLAELKPTAEAKIAELESQISEVDTQLTELVEPVESADNYEELKKQYDDKKAELEKNKASLEKEKADLEAQIKSLEDKIADYEEREGALTTKYNELNSAHAEYDTAAKECADAVSAIIEQLAEYNVSDVHLEYKESLYKIYLACGGTGVIDYLKKCNSELTNRLSAYSKALGDYVKSGEDVESALPDNVATSENSITAVETNYAEAKRDLKAYALKVAQYRAEYDKYVADNAADLAKHTKISSDVKGVIGDKNKATEKIAEDAKTLLEEYENAVQAFESVEDKETNKNYLAAKALYDALNGALDGKTDGQIPQALKDLFAVSDEWFNGYNAAIKVYVNNLNNYDAVISIFNLTNYGNLLVRRIELTAQIEAETDETKKETLNSSLEALNADITEIEATVDLYQGLITTPWTVEQYIEYCTSNKSDEDYAAKKRAFEVIQNGESSIGNAQRVKFVSDKFNLSSEINNGQKHAYEGEIAYYAVEQLTMRLQTAVNVSKEILTEVSGYYDDIATADLLNWAKISDGTRKTVHKDLDYNAHVQVVKAALKELSDKNISTLWFEKFDIETAIDNIDNDETVSINEFVAEFKFADQIGAYENAASDVKTFCDAAMLASRSDYTVPTSTASYIMLVFDLIMIAIFAGYFVYVVYNGVSTAKKENYEKIEEILTD